MKKKLTSKESGGNQMLHRCDQCSKAFTRKDRLTLHLKIHTGKLPHKCSECEKAFGQNSDLKKHMVTHTGDRCHECDQCGKTFKRSKNLKSHIGNVHIKLKPHKCTECDKSFFRKAYLTIHMLTHSAENPFQCDECGKGFMTNGVLQKHIKALHTKERQYKCTECTKEFIEKFQLTMHMRVHSGERPHQCDQCGKAFARTSMLNAHLKSHAGEAAKIYKCEECQQSFITRGILNVHKEIHAKDKKYICLECGVTCSQRKGLIQHMRIHQGIKPHKCAVCEMAFTLKGLLKRHMRKHTGEKQFKCNDCPKSYPRSDELKLHLKVYKEKDYHNCLECTRSFKNEGNFKSHMRAHSRVKDINKSRIKAHQCTICGKMFYYKCLLKRHLKMHSTIKSEKKYMCDRCGVPLASQESIKIHQNIHLGIKPFQCAKCKETFRTKERLKLHELQSKCDKLLKCPTCYKSLWSVDKFKSHMTMHARKNKFKPAPAIQQHIKRIQSGNNPGDTDPINESQLSILRNIYEKENKTPDSKQIRKVSKRLNLTLGQIQDYFKYKNEKELLAKTKIQPSAPLEETSAELSCSKNELKVANNYFGNDEPRILIPRPLNGKGLFVYKNKQKKITAVRSIGANEETVRYFQLYLTSWGPLGNIEKGIAIGYTSLYDVRQAAKAIWQAVMYRGKKSCTYRFEFKEQGWNPRNKTAIPLGIYSDSVDIIRELKWWFRLFLQAMGTLHPHEVIEEYHHIAPDLQAVILPYYSILPIATRRWLDVSLLEMKKHLQDKNNTFPGINVSLTSEHEEWTQNHDYGNPRTKNSSHPK